MTFGRREASRTRLCDQRNAAAYEAMLDSAYDFNTLVLPVGGGQTFMRPPVVTQAQMASLSRERPGRTGTACIYQITREAQLASAPPNWRAYLVRTWGCLASE